MTLRHVDPEAVLRDLKDFQRRTAVWAFQRMFAETDPALRFLVADEVGLGKTHVAKGVIAQVIDHLQRHGDKRHDIVYVCSNNAIARQNLRKLVPKGIEPLEDIERLTMLPLARLDQGGGDRSGVNLLAITPGTSLRFGHSTGRFEERCLAYAFLRATWGASVMNARARWLFWEGVAPETGDQRLRAAEARYRPAIQHALGEFAEVLAEVDAFRTANDRPTIRTLFDTLVDGLAWKRTIPPELSTLRFELVGEVRRIMATVGIAALRPDLIILDEFQRFKDLLNPDPANFAAELAHRLFDHVEPDTGRPTRTLLLSATPYRMFTTADDQDADHYADFVATCAFLMRDPARVESLRARFSALRGALTASGTLESAESICAEIGAELRCVMARTERLAATPDRNGMLCEPAAHASVAASDLRAYLRLGNLAETVAQHEPMEFWKAGPYLFNVMEQYKLKEALDRAWQEERLPAGERLEPGPGLLSWEEVEAYAAIDPQNGRLRWLIDDLACHRAFELLWLPPSLRYYETGSEYESPEAAGLTKRLIFSGWKLVPKVVSILVSFEAERRAYAERGHRYSADYRQRGGQRLRFRTELRTAADLRPGEADTPRRAAAMTAFLLCWPSPTLAELGDPRPLAGPRRPIAGLLAGVADGVDAALAPLLATAPSEGPVDLRWYWAAPLLLDAQRHPTAVAALLRRGTQNAWEAAPGEGFLDHLAEARAMLQAGASALGRPPDDLAKVLADIAVGGPAPCALRALGAVCGLSIGSEAALRGAARIAAGFRSFFNAPEVTAVVVGAGGSRSAASVEDEATSPYWLDAVRHCIGGNLQALLDEHLHVLRDWLGHLVLDEPPRRAAAADDIAATVAQSLDVRTASFRVDIPQKGWDQSVAIDQHRMRSRFAVAFDHQTLEGGAVARVESVSIAFNSPFWPFVLTSTSVGQEGLDFHLWCHAVVHWNLPANPVDLEQREGRVHRYKGHAVRRNIAATLGEAALAEGSTDARGSDLWDALFEQASGLREDLDGEMVPYWVYHHGPAKIERHVPVLPFSRDAAALPRLRKSLAAYRLAFGQPRQEELMELLGTGRTAEELIEIASRLRIDLGPPEG